MADRVGEAVVSVSVVLIAVGVVMMLLFDVDPSAVGGLLEQSITLVVFAGLAVGIIFLPSRFKCLAVQ